MLFEFPKRQDTGSKLGKEGQTCDEVIENLVEIDKKAVLFIELDRQLSREFIPLDNTLYPYLSNSLQGV